MEIELSPAGVEEKVLLERLMELYLYDFSEFDGADLDNQAYYGYPYLDRYWVEPGRAPFLVRVDGALAGFVLVFEYSLLGQAGHMIAEFFVLRKYRRLGVGRAAAFAAFERFPGHWEVSQINENLPAQRFWRSVLTEYTHGEYREVVLADEQWHGPVQSFETAPTRPDPSGDSGSGQ